jgi:hypothetical protein
MLSKANEFRAQAAECDEQASKATGILRDRYIENARWWRDLATQTERQPVYITSTEQRPMSIPGDPG